MQILILAIPSLLIEGKDVEIFDKYFDDAKKMDRKGQIAQVDRLDQKVLELETTSNKNLAEKAKQVGDRIRTELLGKKAKYDIVRRDPKTTPKDFIDRLRSARDQLRRFRDWLRSRFPVIAGLVAFTAGVFSIVFAVVKLTKGAAVETAKGANNAGRAIARFLAKLGPLMASIGSFIISLMSFLAQGLMFIANNLWILCVAIVGYLWNKYRRGR